MGAKDQKKVLVESVVSITEKSKARPKAKKKELMRIPPGGNHKKSFDARCPVCKSKSRDLYEGLFLDWYPKRYIAQSMEVEMRDLDMHMNASKLQDRRQKNYLGFYRKFQNRAMDALDDEELSADVAARLGLDAGKHIDKLEGRIVEQHKIDQNKRITIEAFPAPGAVIQAEVIEDKKGAKQLLPGAAEEKETEEAHG